MLKNCGVPACYDFLSSQPGNSLANILNIFTCTRNNNIVRINFFESFGKFRCYK